MQQLKGDAGIHCDSAMEGTVGVILSSHAHRNEKRNHRQFLFPWVYK